MPLNNAYLPKVDGLQTETSPISSDPRSMSDCLDIISDTDDTLESRHGHPSVVITSPTLYSGATPVDLYAYRNETDKFFVTTYKGSDNKFRFIAISQTGEEITSSSSQSSARFINNIGTTRTSSVNSKPIAFSHDERLFFLTDYGLYFRDFSTPGDGDADKVDFPQIRAVSVTPEFETSGIYGNEGSHWLVPFYQTNVKLVFEIEAKESDKGERILESAPSRIYEVKNFNLSTVNTANRTRNMLVKISGLTLSHIPAGKAVFLKVYRTEQFQITDKFPITEYKLATEPIKITTLTVGDIYLTTNDDIVRTLEGLYNDSSLGTDIVTNHLPLPAKNVTSFENHYIYSNLTAPLIARIGLKQMPTNGSSLTIKLSGAAGEIVRTVTFKTSGATGDAQVNIPANASDPSDDNLKVLNDLTFRGIRPGTSEGSLDTTLNVTVRIKPGTGAGQVTPYAEVLDYTPINPSGSSAVLRIRPASSFDINRFTQPGIAAIVNDSGQVFLFSYSNYRRVSASQGFIDFEGSVSVARDMPTSKQTPGTDKKFHMYFIPGENLSSTRTAEDGVTKVSGLSLYRGDGDNYLSLAPCNNSFEFPVAFPSVGTDNKLFAYSANDLVVNPYYKGDLFKPAGFLLNEMATAISENLSKQINDDGLAIVTSRGGDELDSGVITIEVLDNRYDKIEFKANADFYEPSIGIEYETFGETEKVVSGFVVSKQNNPELIPIGGIGVAVAGAYFPVKVGDPSKPIVASASTRDSVYFLKEDGVARLSLVTGGLVATVQNIYMIDNTVFCQSAGSVQNIEDTIVFLAQDGVYGITGGSVNKLSRSIENDLKKVTNECRFNNKLRDIRSFGNPSKGLYGITFPLSGANYVTYVLNTGTMRWVKWSKDFRGAVTDLDGRLTTLVGDSSENYIRQDRFSSGQPRNPLDQYDEKIDLTVTPSDAGLVRTINQTNVGTLALRFGSQQAYYRTSTGALFKVAVEIVNPNQVKVTFPESLPTFNSGDSLCIGVNSSVTFNPFTASSPSDLKMFSGFHIHTLESVKDLKCSFRTEARTAFSTVTSFSTSPTDRTVYRCNIPLEAVRGRYLYRKIDHSRPFEILTMPAQTIVFRDTGSNRVNKNT